MDEEGGNEMTTKIAIAGARGRMGSADEIHAAAAAWLRRRRMVGGHAAGLPSP